MQEHADLCLIILAHCLACIFRFHRALCSALTSTTNIKLSKNTSLGGHASTSHSYVLANTAVWSSIPFLQDLSASIAATRAGDDERPASAQQQQNGPQAKRQVHLSDSSLLEQPLFPGEQRTLHLSAFEDLLALHAAVCSGAELMAGSPKNHEQAACAATVLHMQPEAASVLAAMVGGRNAQQSDDRVGGLGGVNVVLEGGCRYLHGQMLEDAAPDTTDLKGAVYDFLLSLQGDDTPTVLARRLLIGRAADMRGQAGYGRPFSPAWPHEGLSLPGAAGGVDELARAVAGLDASTWSFQLARQVPMVRQAEQVTCLGMASSVERIRLVTDCIMRYKADLGAVQRRRHSFEALGNNMATPGGVKPLPVY